MPELNQDSLQRILIQLDRLQQEANNSQKKLHGSINTIAELIQYIQTNQNEIIGPANHQQDIHKKHIINLLSGITTEKPERISTISKLIDEFTPNHLSGFLYTGLRKLEFIYQDSDFINKKGGREQISLIINHITNNQNIANFGLAADKITVKEMLNNLRQRSQDPKKQLLINSLITSLDNCFVLQPQEIAFTENDPHNQDESTRDWVRTAQEPQNIKINDHTVDNFADFTGKIEQLVGTKLLADKLLYFTKTTNICDPDLFMGEHGVMISQDQENSQDKYHFRRNNTGRIEVDFSCNGKAANPSNENSIVQGIIDIKAILEPQNNGQWIITIHRKFVPKLAAMEHKDKTQNPSHSHYH